MIKLAWWFGRFIFDCRYRANDAFLLNNKKAHMDATDIEYVSRDRDSKSINQLELSHFHVHDDLNKQNHRFSLGLDYAGPDPVFKGLKRPIVGYGDDYD